MPSEEELMKKRAQGILAEITGNDDVEVVFAEPEVYNSVKANKEYREHMIELKQRLDGLRYQIERIEGRIEDLEIERDQLMIEFEKLDIEYHTG